MAKAETKKKTAKQPVKKNPVGAPRTTSPPINEMIELGKEMLAWFKANADAIHFTDWYSIEKMILKDDWKSLIQKKEFIPYYHSVRNILINRHSKCKEIDKGIAQRYIGLLDPELRDHEKTIKVEDAEIKAKQEKEPPNDGLLTSILNGLKTLGDAAKS